jgi:heme-degrading monooxygenase HmoA
MIIREWRGRARLDRAEAYPKHFRESVAPELKNIAGFLGADLCRSLTGDRIEFLVVSRWRSMEAIRAFAGDEPGKAVVEPGAIAALEEFDAFVRHYETIETLSV